MKLTALIKSLAITAAVVLLAVLFFTNPDQSAHLKAVTEAVDLRFPKPTPGSYEHPVDRLFTSIIEYHNYWIFSKTTLFDATLSFGILGRVQTTNDVTRVVTGPPTSH